MKILTKGTYYGSMNAEHTMNGILFSEYDYLIDQTDWHFHENPYFMYVLEGNLLDINKKEKTACPSGSLLLHNWQEPHFNSKASQNARGFHIEFDKSWFKKNNIDSDLWEGSQLLKNPKLHHILAKLYAEFKYGDVFSEISCELLLSELCENIEGEKAYACEKNPLWLPRLIELIDQGIQPLNLKALSEQLGVHPNHLSRAMPTYFATTLGDYMRQMKIKKATEYLLSSNKSLFDISYDCGFSDQSHFSRTFKMYMGMTPREFQNKI